MENGPFIDDVPIKLMIFHGYVSHNQRVIFHSPDTSLEELANS